MDVQSSRSDNLDPVYKTLLTARTAVGSVILSVMFISSAITLRAIWITPGLRVKAYALTTSMIVSNLILSVVLFNYFLHETIGAKPCSLKLYKAIVQPLERWIIYSSFVHVSFIAVDRYVAVEHALHYENRMTPTVIRNLIVAIWLTAGVFSLPGYLGFVWPDPESCIATRWPTFEAVVEISLVAVGCTLVVVVNTRIWKTVMHSELQQQQPSPAAPEAGRGNVVEPGVRMFWQHRQLIRKHRATRTIMAILAVDVCLFFPHILFRLFGVAGFQFVSRMMQMATSLLGIFAFAVNGFMYAVVNHDFRRAFKRILSCHVGNSVAPA